MVRHEILPPAFTLVFDCCRRALSLLLSSFVCFPRPDRLESKRLVGTSLLVCFDTLAGDWPNLPVTFIFF